MIFNKLKFPVGTPVLDIKYKYLGSQNNNLFYFFNGQLEYILAYYFANLETTKHNIDKFLINLFMKPMTKNFLYCNVNE